MLRFGYLFSQLIVLIPLLALVVAGVILAVRRRPVIGGRRAGFVLTGTALLGLHLVASLIWALAFPTLITDLDIPASQFSVLVSTVNVLTTILMIAGLALLLAAAVSRPRPAPGEHPYRPGHPQGGYGPAPQQPYYAAPGSAPGDQTWGSPAPEPHQSQQPTAPPPDPTRPPGI